MTFLSLDLCKELQAAGCKSESGFYYPLGKGTPYLITVFNNEEDCTLAFTLLDFLAPTEQARENARIWFGKTPLPTEDYGDRFMLSTSMRGRIYAHKIVDLSPSADVEEYFHKHKRAAACSGQEA